MRARGAEVLGAAHDRAQEPLRLDHVADELTEQVRAVPQIAVERSLGERLERRSREMPGKGPDDADGAARISMSREQVRGELVIEAHAVGLVQPVVQQEDASHLDLAALGMAEHAVGVEILGFVDVDVIFLTALQTVQGRRREAQQRLSERSSEEFLLVLDYFAVQMVVARSQLPPELGQLRGQLGPARGVEPQADVPLLQMDLVRRLVVDGICFGAHDSDRTRALSFAGVTAASHSFWAGHIDRCWSSHLCLLRGDTGRPKHDPERGP